MSAFAVSVYADSVTISMDTASTFPSGSRVYTVDRFQALPLRHMVVAGHGAFQGFYTWRTMLGGLSHAVPAGDIDQVARAAPEALKGAAGALSVADRRQGFLVIHGGMTAAGARAYIYQYPDFVEVAVPARSAALVPEPDPAAPGYDDMMAMLPVPLADVEAYHEASLRNAFWQWCEGLTPPGLDVGGAMISARIDAEGIRIRKLGDLPVPANPPAPGGFTPGLAQIIHKVLNS